MLFRVRSPSLPPFNAGTGMLVAFNSLPSYFRKDNGVRSSVSAHRTQI